MRFLFYLVIGLAIGLITRYYELSIMYTFLFLIAAIFLGLSYKIFKLQKMMKNPEIVEMEDSQMDAIMETLPSDITDFSAENFIFYDKFILIYGAIKINIFIFKRETEDVFYLIYHYPSLNRLVTMLTTHFKSGHSLLTTNSTYIKYHEASLKDNFCQYAPEKTDAELLDYHLEGLAYLNTKFESELMQFPDSKFHRDFFLQSQIDEMEKLGSFMLLKIYKAAMTNNLEKYAKPISVQLEENADV